MKREITCVALDVTTVCNRACRDCCAGINMGLRPAIHHTWEYFERAAEHLRGVPRLHVTGGEPTTHPQFRRIASEFKSLFQCETLTVQTNGFRIEGLEHFDHVYVSRYSNNGAAVDFIRATYPSTEWPHGEEGFTPRSRRGTGAGCERGRSETVAYANGKLYGCCVAPGIPEAEGIEPSADWRERVTQAPLPCSACWFSE